MKLHFTGDVEMLSEGIEELSGCLAYSVAIDGYAVHAQHCPGSPLIVKACADGAELVYDRRIHFFRALGLLLENLQAGRTDFHLEEQPQFDQIGPMFDVSQGNAVMNVECVKHVLRRMAVMGLDMLMLYCEDSYVVEGQPYFGYMRGRYTQEELRECDAYAELFGIEMIPCIQTLAHLTDVLKWSVYDNIKEDQESLLVDCEETYQFLEDLIRAASRPFRTRKIHIGMDEAWKLGLGTYLQLHGLTPLDEIMQRHLARVMEILHRLGLKPMMWSDMFLKASPHDDYFAVENRIPERTKQNMPKDVSLVYWDYYHTEEEFYEVFIEKHRILGEPIFAGGIWTWTGFAPNWGMTWRSMNPALMACKKKKVRNVIATIWGDNGTECNIYANLFGLSLFAEHAYSFELDEEKLRRRFEFCTGGCFDDFYRLKYLDETPGCRPDNLERVNPSKYLMWQDILTGLFDRNIEGLSLNGHYEKLAEQFGQAEERNREYAGLFRYYCCVADVLAIKAEAGVRITKAYRENNRETLCKYADEILPELSGRVRRLRKVHMENWFAMHKVQGWDIMDMRYGSLLIRIESAAEELRAYLDGSLRRLEELEEERLYYNGRRGLVSYANHYGRIVSPSRIAPEA